MSDNYQRPSQPIRDTVDEALNRKPSLRERIVAWLVARFKGGPFGATNGGYWGGISMLDPRRWLRRN